LRAQRGNLKPLAAFHKLSIILSSPQLIARVTVSPSHRDGRIQPRPMGSGCPREERFFSPVLLPFPFLLLPSSHPLVTSSAVERPINQNADNVGLKTLFTTAFPAFLTHIYPRNSLRGAPFLPTIHCKGSYSIFLSRQKIGITCCIFKNVTYTSNMIQCRYILRDPTL